MGFRLALVVLALIVGMSVFAVGFCFSQPMETERPLTLLVVSPQGRLQV